VQFHFKSNEDEEGITGSLPGHDLHRLGSSFEFLAKPINDIGGSPWLVGSHQTPNQWKNALFSTFLGFWNLHKKSYTTHNWRLLLAPSSREKWSVSTPLRNVTK
jgi:hypothetical protein